MISPFGAIVLAGVTLGGLAMVGTARRYAIATGEALGLAGVLVLVGLIGAHVFDVLCYQRGEPGVWLRVLSGISLYGALIAVSATTAIWAQARRIELAGLADCVALGVLVAVVVGRIGCALVHDHPGVPTELPIGVDFPNRVVAWLGLHGAGGTVRLHDCGLEELVALLPLGAIAWTLWRRRLRPGVVAVVIALGYAALRFALDFLRLPATEPSHAGLTAGQWASVAMAAVAAFAATTLTAADRS